MDIKSFFSDDSIKKNFGYVASTYAWGRHFNWNRVLEADFFLVLDLFTGPVIFLTKDSKDVLYIGLLPPEIWDLKKSRGWGARPI